MQQTKVENPNLCDDCLIPLSSCPATQDELEYGDRLWMLNVVSCPHYDPFDASTGTATSE